MADPVIVETYEMLVIPPELVDGRRFDLQAGVDLDASPAGGALALGTLAPPQQTMDVAWQCMTREALAEVEAFLARRRGRVVPFWMPSYRQELEYLAADGPAAIIVRAGGYAALFASQNDFDTLHPWVRIAPDGTHSPMYLNVATDLGDGTERLQFGYGGPPGPQHVSCQLHFARLASDSITITHQTAHAARVTAQILTLPRDRPDIT